MACSRALKQVLLTKGRAFVYSTALPVPVVAGSLAALRVATRDNTHRRAPPHPLRIPSGGTLVDRSQCTSAPHRAPDLAPSGTHGALPLENLDNLYGVAPPHQTD